MDEGEGGGEEGMAVHMLPPLPLLPLHVRHDTMYKPNPAPCTSNPTPA